MMNAKELLAKAATLAAERAAEKAAEQAAEQEAFEKKLNENIQAGLKLLEPYIVEFYSRNSDEHEFSFSIAYGDNEEVTLVNNTDEDYLAGYSPEDLVLTGKYIYNTIRTNIILSELGWEYGYQSDPNVTLQKKPHELGIRTVEAASRIRDRRRAENERAMREYCEKTGQECPV